MPADKYPDRLELYFDDDKKVKVVFAKNADAHYGWECWLEGRAAKPISGRAVSLQEMVLLKHIFMMSNALHVGRL